MYAAQSYDAANLLDSAMTKTKGNVSDKEALRTALKAADFKSVRGAFKFGSNQFPISNFYRVDVVKDASGAAFATKGPIEIKYRNDLVSQCKMK